MRVTESMVANRVIYDISASNRRMLELQRKLSSGKRIEVPSDDPVGTITALRLRNQVDQAKRFIANTDQSISWLEATDNALASLGDLVQRVRELVIYGANGAIPDTSRQALAEEVKQLLDQIVQIGNSTFGNRFMFAGTKTTAAPFSQNSGQVSYLGNRDMLYREISQNVELPYNVPGIDVFGYFSTSLDRSGVIGAVAHAIEMLEVGNVEALSSEVLSDLDNAIDAVLTVRSDVGARINRLQYTMTRLEDIELNAASLLSKAEDLDIAAAAVQAATAENGYRLGIAAAAKIIQPTLIDFLS